MGSTGFCFGTVNLAVTQWLNGMCRNVLGEKAANWFSGFLFSL
jgi:hypothetical protein